MPGKPLHMNRPSRRNSSTFGLLFRSKSTCINSIVVVSILAIISFNTWATLNSALQQKDAASQTLQGVNSPAHHGDRLFVPEGPSVALPSIQITSDEEASIKRGIYGGKGDKAHLGGFTSFDPMGVSPTLWAHMVNHLGIKSVLDMGCGLGISTSWFVTHGLEYVVCAEGSHDAVTQSLLPKIENVPERTTYELVEHDFSRGPWWPSRTVDAVWCVEFTEHVGRNYQPNYLTAWRKAALIFFTHSNWGGWHHVEVHDDNWWIMRMEAMGFVYSGALTKEMREKAKEDHARLDLVKDMKTQNRTTYSVGQHIWGSMLVFINPLVSSRIEHEHLFAEHGCFNGEKGQECGKEGLGSGVSDVTPIPDRF